MINCWKCNEEVPENSKSCPHCAAPLGRQAVEMMATIGPGGASAAQIVPGVLVNDRYDVLREIGRGGMGIVYLAHDRIMEQDVAMKVIPQELCLDPRAVSNLKKETAIALTLTHSNIVRLHTLDTWEGQAFVVMEYVGGGTLAHKCAELSGKFIPEQFLPLLEQLARALDYSHSLNPAVIHRDLKPLNILLTESGEIKIADFGLARVLRDTASRVSGHDSAGTLAYMAPEQIRGKGVGKKSDLYALAAITYEMLSGKPPFYTGDLRWQIMHEEVEPIEGLPDHINATLLQALDKEPENRQESAAEFVQQLKGEKQVQHKTKKKAVKKQKPPKSQTAKSAFPFFPLVFVLLLIAGAAGGGYYFKSDVKKLMRGGPVLTVESDPAGAMVYLDGAEAGKSPVAVNELPSGSHQVRLILEKYQPYEKKVLIQSDTPAHLNASLIPEPYGDIQIASNPSGADVLVDGKVLGKTPVTLSHLAAGNRQIEVQKDGFDLWQQEISIKPLKVAKVTATLLSSFGRLSVISKPNGAQVFLDGKELGKTPLHDAAALKGNHHLELQLKGYKSWSKRVAIELNKPVSLSADLERSMGSIKLTSVPSGASVQLNGKDVGKTPIEVEIDEGKVKVEVEQGLYEKWQQIIKVEAGKLSTKHIKLAQALTYTDPVTGMEFVFVKGGCYQMGDTFGDGNKDEKPVHEVCVDDFYIGKYEVTQGEYQKIMETNPSYFKKGERYPVEQISWHDARNYVNKLNSRSGKTFRLPTEAEWEYAARSVGKKEKYAGSNTPDNVAWYSNKSGNSTHQVGTKQPNGLGLYDMSGNVWEWCSDWYDNDYYSSSPRSNPQGARPGDFRVFRGGGWYDKPAIVRAANREWIGPGVRINNLGLRLVFAGPME